MIDEHLQDENTICMELRLYTLNESLHSGKKQRPYLLPSSPFPRITPHAYPEVQLCPNNNPAEHLRHTSIVKSPM